MNKIKATKREMKENYYIIGIGYCKAQYLLNNETPIAYSSGVYGWSCDYYLIDNVIISTGYSYLDNQNTNYDYKKLRKLDEKARAILHDNSIDYEVARKKVKRMLRTFVKNAKDSVEWAL